MAPKATRRVPCCMVTVVAQTDRDIYNQGKITPCLAIVVRVAARRTNL